MSSTWSNIDLNTGVSTFASGTSQSTNQGLQKSLHLSKPEEIE